MRASRFLFLAQLAIGCALLASAALYVHYLDPVNSDFCGLKSGCEAVRRSPIAYFGSRYVSLPLFSILAYTGLLLLSLRCAPLGGAPTRPPADSSLSRRLKTEPSLLLFAASGFGAFCALVLIAYQAFGIGQFCWLCLIVDGSAIAAAAASFGLAWTQRPGSSPSETDAEKPEKSLPLRPVLATAALLVAGPLTWNLVQPPLPVPQSVSALYVAGKINIVEFADFQCPYCRKLHAVLAPLVEEYREDVNFVRLNRPLARHNMAKPAAYAAVCAAAQGKEEPMADRLFRDSLSGKSIQAAAKAVGLDMATFNHCLIDPGTDAELQRQQARLKDEDFKGLPTTYVGQKLLIGVRSEAAFREAFERARTPASQGVSGTLFTGLWIALMGLAWIVPWWKAASPAQPQPGRGGA